jgi:hypothetical protein
MMIAEQAAFENELMIGGIFSERGLGGLGG